MYLRFTDTDKLMEMLKQSKTDLYWLESQIEGSTGQPYAHYSAQYYKEKKNHDTITEELEKRGLVQ